MFEKSQIKQEIMKVLMEWDYNKEKANPYNIAKQIGASVSSVVLILRYLKSAGLVISSKGSWHLV